MLDCGKSLDSNNFVDADTFELSINSLTTFELKTDNNKSLDIEFS